MENKASGARGASPLGTPNKEHTPGPWHPIKTPYRGHASAAYYIMAGKRAVAHVKQSTSSPVKENARLVAAAPDLLEALLEMTETYWGVDDAKNGDGGQPPACVRRARAAIRKARGACQP